MSRESADIIISTFQRGWQIEPTIISVRKSSYADFTLWVLDQSHDDATERCLAPHVAQDPRIRYLRLPERGIAATRNSGAALGDAPYLLFINDDCLADITWVAAMVAELRRDEGWLVFGRVLAGPRQCAADVGKQTVLALKEWPLREVYRGNRREIGFGHGHNMAVRRASFTQLGGFDELLGTGAPFCAWDDLDLGYRALASGGAIVYTPAALVYHAHWIGWEGVRGSYRRYGLGAGAAAAKYVRGGDFLAVLLLLDWMLDKGLRQVLSGLLKRRSSQRVRVGLSQLFYPLLGVAASLRYPVNRRAMLYGARPPLRRPRKLIVL